MSVRKNRYGSPPPDGVSNRRWVNPNEATLEAGCRSSSSETRAAPRNPSPPMTAYDSGAEARRGRGRSSSESSERRMRAVGRQGRPGACTVLLSPVADRVSLVLLSATECEGWFDQHQAACAGERREGEATRRRGVTCSVDHPLEKQLWSETYFARGTEGLGRNREASGGRGAGVVHAESEIDAVDALAESKAVRTAVATRKSPC